MPRTVAARRPLINPFAEDTFTRANAPTTLGNTPIGNFAPTLVSGGTAFGVLNNQAYNSDNVNNNNYFQIYDFGVSDGIFKIDVDRGGANTVGAIFRYVDLNNYWSFRVNGASRRIYVINGGVETNMFDYVTSLSLVTYTIWLSGNSIMLLNSSGAYAHVISSIHNTATKFGLYKSGNSNLSRWDNLQMF